MGTRPALIAFGTVEMFAIMEIPEELVPMARARGWIVIGTDSELVEPVDVNLHSHPRRRRDDAKLENNTRRDRGDARRGQ